MIGSMSLPKDDLEHVLNKTRNLFKDAYGKKFFITGGTGFFGLWLLESFVWINQKLNLNASVSVLTRCPGIFKKNNPHFKKMRSVELIKGDVRSFRFPKGRYNYIIHAATDNDCCSSPLEMFKNNVAGTQRILDFARFCRNETFLLTSSGAVYGEQPRGILSTPEDYQGGPVTVNIKSAYGESKRVSEFLCARYAEAFGIEVKIARCFAFLGPNLQLNANFAAGNFIRDALNGGPICVRNNKSVYRSYLYASDLAVWLWTILFKGKVNRPYNVGSSKPCSILELAGLVANNFSPAVKIRIQNKTRDNPKLIERYVPDTKLAQKELGLRQFIGLKDGIRKTIDFYSSRMAACKNPEK